MIDGCYFWTILLGCDEGHNCYCISSDRKKVQFGQRMILIDIYSLSERILYGPVQNKTVTFTFLRTIGWMIAGIMAQQLVAVDVLHT